MYIKQVIIQGFRSYRDQTIIDPFSSKHNVIVGRNGSGKSNFFFAIQFVLSDEFSNMRQEDRQSLLHEGTGARVVSAFVEIIFDNSDNRLPIDKEEVTLRRVIGSKKDQYFLDKKNVTKTDVMNLLESAGFSRSNPYYIVKQGKISQLTTAKDKDRLQLLREVAGTRVYDQKKEESRSLLRDSEGKIEKIEELLKYIEERLETLEAEKEELKAYQKWDKERRCLEYTIHDKELKETKDKLEKLESSRQHGTEQSNEHHKLAAEIKDSIEHITYNIKELSDHIQSVTSEKQQLQEECQGQIKQRAKLDLVHKDLETSVKNDTETKEEIRRQLALIGEQIESQEARLKHLLPAYNEHCSREEELTSGLKVSEQRRTDLFAKQGRTNQFNSREERDQWIKQELDSLQKNASRKESQINAMRTSVQEQNTEMETIKRNISSRSENLEERRRQMEETNRKHAELKKERDKLTNERKELWKQESDVEQTLLKLREECRRVDQNLKSCFSKATVNGIESVKQIVEEKKLSGVFGPLIDNFNCGEKFHTCVEVTAGNKLSQIIVDTDKTASTILSHMNKNKMRGEVSFLPLNRLNAHPTQFPQSSDVAPMIKKLTYDEYFDKAMQHVFGKTLICRDIDVAAKYAKSENLDCITMEGDQVSRRGALTGGYYDARTSRLALQKRLRELENAIHNETETSNNLKTSLQKTDASITVILGELQKLETKQVELRETYDKQKMDVKDLSQQERTKSQALESKKRTMAKLQKDLDACKRTIGAMSEELGTELLSQLNPEDQQELARLNENIRLCQEGLKEALTNRMACERDKNTIENLLSSNLKRRRDELQQSLEEISERNRRQELENCGADLHTVNETIKESKKKEKELEDELDRAIKAKTGLSQELEVKQSTEREILEAIQNESKNIEKTANKRSLLMKKKDECMKKIRELGSLPADAFQKHSKVNLKALWKKLRDCNEELKKYIHVNKKALDQFVNFSEQKEKLLKRKDELDKGYRSIVELMEVLEHRKHEAILFTFKQVTHYFAEVFKELVPHGKASLVMKTEEKTDRQDEDDTVSSSAGSSQRSVPQVDQFSGISIKVSFTGKSAETREMNQLSGGQKSLVALTLIFAIQKCDPAPFYLFDEIDQALDPQYRKAVAEMIRKSAVKAQFITTTFRPELLESADQFYGVKFRNKVSHILAISAEQAKDFIEDDESEGKKD